MTEAAVVHTNLPASAYAGIVLGLQVNRSLQTRPDVAVLFISRIYNARELLQAFKQTCNPKILLGCSTSGTFTGNTGGLGLASAFALRSNEMLFSAGLGHGLSKGETAAARQLLSTFRGMTSSSAYAYPYRSALFLSDILGASPASLAQQLAALTDHSYQLFGGGASGVHELSPTLVFYDTQAYTDSVVALEILSHKPIGIALHHHWQPASSPLSVTAAQGRRIIGINDAPAIDALRAYAQATGQAFALEDLATFFSKNVIGIQSSSSQEQEQEQAYQLRVPITTYPDGSVLCSADVPVGATIFLMRYQADTAPQALEEAMREALKRLQGYRPALALFFNHPSSRPRLKDDHALALQAVPPDIPFHGCQLYGQAVRTEKAQVQSLHTCTPAICLIPK